MARPRQRQRALDWLLALPPREYVTREQLAEGIGTTMRGAGNLLARLLEDGDVTCASNDDGITWTWRAKRGRCESVLREGGRSWRCRWEAGHTGRHASPAGGRGWR